MPKKVLFRVFCNLIFALPASAKLVHTTLVQTTSPVNGTEVTATSNPPNYELAEYI